MDLILWRHAEAEDLGPDGDDLSRRLTPKGERQAERMADWLNRRLAATTRILVSPAKRTQQTAKALDRSFKTVAALAPGASVDDVLAVARWPDAPEAVLVVGHQPVLGHVVARLVGGIDAEAAGREWPVRKAAVVWLRQRDRDDSGQVVIQAVQGPDFL
jgi:phosphohistidine phosphatase